MKKTIIGGMCALLCACGGGGGSDEDACMSYCSSGCWKAVECGFLPEAGQETCKNTCYVGSQDRGASEARCEVADARISELTCAQLAQLLGYSRSMATYDKSASQGTEDPDEFGMSLATQCNE